MKRYFAGIDGGSTKCAGALITSGGNVVARAHARGLVLSPVPTSTELSHVDALISTLCTTASIDRDSIACCGLCLSGVDFDDEIPGQKKALAKAIGMAQGNVSLANDAIGALWGATDHNPAVIVQHGTAFTAAWRRMSGDEHLFDHLDAGGIFDMRQQLLKSVARMIDGRLKASPLLNAALRHYGFTQKAFAEASYKKHIPWDRIMSTPPLIYKAWQRKDPHATDLVQCAAQDYATAACAMLSLAGKPGACAVFGGGIINCAPESFLGCIQNYLRKHFPSIKSMRPILEPCFGAALMAVNHAGEDAGRAFRVVSEKAGQ